MELKFCTWLEVETYLEKSRAIVLPIGSTEQHGPNGLIGTDALEAWVLALFREGAETTGEALRLLDGVAGEPAADALSAALAAGG